jgi:two-component system response regulator NreC
LRILIADDNEAVRKGACSILQSRQDIEVCGEASTGKDAVIKAQLLKPDLVILDFSFPDSSGLDVAMEVRESLPEVPILLLTAHGSPMIDEIRKRGLQGYVSKSEAGTTLLAAIDAILGSKRSFFPIS